MTFLYAILSALLVALLLYPVGRHLRQIRRRLAAEDQSARSINVGLRPVAKQLGGPYTSQMQAVLFNPTDRDVEIKSAKIVNLDGSLRHEVSLSRVTAGKGFEEYFEIEDSDWPNVFEHKPGRWFNAIFEVTFVWLRGETWRANSEGEAELRSSPFWRRAIRWSLKRYPAN